MVLFYFSITNLNYKEVIAIEIRKYNVGGGVNFSDCVYDNMTEHTVFILKNVTCIFAV